MTTRTVLITGATGALGTHIAMALSKTGYTVILNYRKNKPAVEKIAQKIGAKTIVQADVTKLNEVQKMFKKIGRVDVLINTVGDFIWKPLADTSEEEFVSVLNSNLLSAWYCTKVALPAMRKQKYGRIINFGSAGCDQITTRPMTTPYYIAKTGLLMLTKSLARELANTGVTVNIISPGILPTSLVKPPGAPIMKFDDIANAVLFLVETKSPVITGANIKVSGDWKPE